MNILDKILRIIALASIEPIIFGSMFFGAISGSYVPVAIFCVPIVLIVFSVFRPYKVWGGSFWAYFSAVFILIPLGLSSMITEKYFVVYDEYRIFVWIVIIFVSTFLVNKFVKIKGDENEDKNDYFKKRFRE